MAKTFFAPGGADAFAYSSSATFYSHEQNDFFHHHQRVGEARLNFLKQNVRKGFNSDSANFAIILRARYLATFGRPGLNVEGLQDRSDPKHVSSFDSLEISLADSSYALPGQCNFSLLVNENGKASLTQEPTLISKVLAANFFP